MNKIARIPLILLTVLLGLVFVFPIYGELDGFIINNADDSVELGFQRSSSLFSLLNQVHPRIVIESANDIKPYELEPVSATLSNLISSLNLRILIQYANANRDITLNYPADLIGDKASPQMSGVTVSKQADGHNAVIWQTNEFTNSLVELGTNPGNYNRTFPDPLFVKEHVVYLDGLQDGLTYYYRATSKDQSGNTTRSEEQYFIYTIQHSLFLPTVLRE